MEGVNKMVFMQVMRDASEIVIYDISDLPVKVIRERLSNYPEMKAICHWHEDVELMHIVKGEMNYEINGKTVRLKENSSVFINSGQLHYGFSVDRAECEFVCVLFHPTLLRVSDRVYRDTVVPIIGNDSIEYLLFEHTGGGNPLSGHIMEIARSKQNAGRGYEWEILGSLHKIWGMIQASCEAVADDTVTAANTDRQLSRDMVSYIFRHCAEPLTLNMIAAAGSVSRSKCCLIFKKYLGESPIDFVNSYRLEKSCQMLRSTDQSITEIAMNCGFNHSSYYAKLFAAKYGCTPSEYRRNKLSHA